LVATVATDEARTALIEMARVWSRLADEQDEAFPPMLMPERSQPVVQQQQQPQAPPDKSEEFEIDRVCSRPIRYYSMGCPNLPEPYAIDLNSFGNDAT
jgi:hypothetical protein